MSFWQSLSHALMLLWYVPPRPAPEHDEQLEGDLRQAQQLLISASSHLKRASEENANRAREVSAEVIRLVRRPPELRVIEGVVERLEPKGD